MSVFKDFVNLTHHSYFISFFKEIVLELKNHLKNTFNINSSGNPDFYHEKFAVFSIDDSRKIKELHSSKSFKEGSKKVFIIEADGITHEAQNALLKIFEEPNENVHFFLIMPSLSVLLPTLRSRLLVIDTERDLDKEEYSFDILKFLKMSPKEKVAFVDEMAENISDEKIQKGDAQRFLAELETLLRKDGLEKNKNGLKAVLKARDYMNDRSSSVKQILEYVALSL